MIKKLSLFLLTLLIVSTLCIPVFAVSYTVPVSTEPVTIDPGENNQLMFQYDGSSVTWSTFKNNPDFTLYITNSIGKANYRILVNNNYSSTFSTISSSYLVGLYGVEINWDYLNSNFTEIIPDDLTTKFVIVCGSGNTRNINFYISNEVEEDDREHGGSGSEIPDDPNDTKKWYDYLLDGIKTYFNKLFEEIKEMIYPKELTESLKGLIGAFQDFFSSFSSITIKPFNDFLDSLDTGVLAYLSQIWDLPIIKDYMYALIIVALVAGLFKLFITA